jgi:hypothetical protein
MPFALETRDQLMGVLEWPASDKDYLDYLQSLMTLVETVSGDPAVERIESLLSEFIAAQVQLVEAIGSSQASMTRADVVEWDPKLTYRNLGDRVNGLRSQISAALGVNLGCCDRVIKLRKG